ncbi:hypothetical protein CSUI_001347 [Cystoisospora suis]|uniref:Uncharacterized protein n=1 Tax=Cystoisospora suis TaxID=483139 RepID=A0A2C6LAT8_9APIC|nr:hypothetical protein CSUI_001347 [Cystoisospora suis]
MLPLVLRQQMQRKRRRRDFSHLPSSLSSSSFSMLISSTRRRPEKKDISTYGSLPGPLSSLCVLETFGQHMHRSIASRHPRRPSSSSLHRWRHWRVLTLSTTPSHSPSSSLSSSSSFSPFQRLELSHTHSAPTQQHPSLHLQSPSPILLPSVSSESKSTFLEIRRTSEKSVFLSHHEKTNLHRISLHSSSCSLSSLSSSSPSSPLSSLTSFNRAFSTHQNSSSSSSSQARQSTSSHATSPSPVSKPQEESRSRFQLFKRSVNLFSLSSKKTSLQGDSSSKKKDSPSTSLKISPSLSRDKKEEEKEQEGENKKVGTGESLKEGARSENRLEVKGRETGVKGRREREEEGEKADEDERETLRDTSRHWLAEKASRQSRRRRGMGPERERYEENRGSRRIDSHGSYPRVAIVLAHASSLDHPTSPVSKPFVLFTKALLSNLFLPSSSLSSTEPSEVDDDVSSHPDKPTQASLFESSERSSSSFSSNSHSPGDSKSGGEEEEKMSRQSSSFSPSLHPVKWKYPFEFLTVDVSTEPQLAACLRVSSLPSLIMFYYQREHAVLSPTSTTFCDAHLLKYFREALLLSSSSSSSISSRPRQILFSAPIKPEAVVHAVKVSRELALSQESIQEAKERTSGGLKEGEKMKKRTEAGEGMEGKKRVRGENFLSFSRESTPAAMIDAWTEYKTTRGEKFSSSTWLGQSRISMRNKEIAEVERLLEKMERRDGDHFLTKGHTVFSKLYLLLYKDRDKSIDRQSLINVLEEIVGSSIHLSPSPSGKSSSSTSHNGEEKTSSSPSTSSSSSSFSSFPETPVSPSPFYPSPSSSSSRRAFSEMYEPRGFMNELETDPVYGKLVAKATVALFDSPGISDQEVDDLLEGFEKAVDIEEKIKLLQRISPQLQAALTLEEPARPLDEAVHFSHVSTKNERDHARYRPSIFFFSSHSSLNEEAEEEPASSSSFLSCPLRTLSRLYRIKASRLFHGDQEDPSTSPPSLQYKAALTYAIRSYRLESQGDFEEVLKGRPSRLPGGWRGDESPVYGSVPVQVEDASSSPFAGKIIRGGGIGGNCRNNSRQNSSSSRRSDGDGDLFDQMACLRAGWPARTLLTVMYMALGAKHPVVQQSRAELEILLGTDTFVPVIFPRTKAVVGGKPIMMRGKSGKWHWLGPYWKPPWAPPNKARWQTGPEEWSWTDPTR